MSHHVSADRIAAFARRQQGTPPASSRVRRDEYAPAEHDGVESRSQLTQSFPAPQYDTPQQYDTRPQPPVSDEPLDEFDTGSDFTSASGADAQARFGLATTTSNTPDPPVRARYASLEDYQAAIREAQAEALKHGD